MMMMMMMMMMILKLRERTVIDGVPLSSYNLNVKYNYISTYGLQS